jgi:ABC-type multidrug transport system ATPase subunit/pSer/pThr/pTyr-binding forkhead associated (FHA) protein
MEPAKSNDVLLLDGGITMQSPRAELSATPVNDFVIGRDPHCGFPLSDSRVSWRHARIFYAGEKYFLTDLGSTNGTSLNGNLVEPQQQMPLQPGDVICIGDCELRCASGQSAAPPTPCPPASGVLLIGRSPQADIVLSQSDVSWNHARLERRGDGWFIQDLGSSNGTFVNGARISESVVQAKDEVRIASAKLSLDGRMPARSVSSGGMKMEARGLSRIVYSGGAPLVLLDNVSLHIRPRELVAIIGASGAGKSTLLQALCGYQPATHGKVLLNDIDYYSHREQFRATIGYVPQDDIVHRDLTVRAALRYAARLRLPPDTREGEIEAAVHKVMAELEITHRAGHLIRTLSGGERKRVNIGVELLTSPSLLFLDEPTTGLDIALERRIMRLLRALADEGRTVIQVTHSVTALEECDKVACMAEGGRLAFFGTPQEALRFFGVSQFADIYDRLNANVAVYTKSTFGSFHSLFFHPNAPSPLVPPRYAAWAQFCILTQRYLEIIRNDTYNLAFWLAQAPFVGLVIWMLFDGNIFSASQSPDGSGNFPIGNAPLLLFILAFSAVCFGLCSSAREIVKEKIIYHRERHVAVGIWPYLCSKIAVLGMVSFGQCLILVLMVSLKINLHLGAGGMLGFFLLLWLGAAAAVLLGLTVSALAASADQSITLVAVLLLTQVMFSGLLPLEKLSVVLRWIPSLCIARWSYGGLCAGTNLAQRWSDVGMGSQVHDVMRTPDGEAWFALIVIIMALLLALGGMLKNREKQGG